MNMGELSNLGWENRCDTYDTYHKKITDFEIVVSPGNFRASRFSPGNAKGQRERQRHDPERARQFNRRCGRQSVRPVAHARADHRGNIVDRHARPQTELRLA